MKRRITYWTSVSKKLLFFILAIFLTFILFKLAIFYLPFVIAFVIACLMEPIIKKIMRKFKISRRISSIIVFIITFGSILGLLIWGITTIFSESTNLLSGLNEYYNKASLQVQNVISKINFDKLNISNELKDVINNSTIRLLQKFSNSVQDFLTKLLSSITAIPTIGVYFAITILALYFICTDKIYMLDELEHHLPEKWMKEISKHLKDLIKTLGGYLKAQAILILISFVVCLCGLYILYFFKFNIRFPLIIALGIAFVDSLPILGSGTVMIPWGIFSGLNGDLKLGIAIITLWLIMSVLRQFIEPKIVSGNIGIHPIFTIIAMYTGFKFYGLMRNVYRSNYTYNIKKYIF